MLSDQSELLTRIESFDIDGGSVGLPFAARLARENGWSGAYARRVIAEYKRFVFLSMISDTPVCPSEDVDAAWHLHLTYTRSYWKRFCGEVLGRPLHHEPTKGGPAEHEKHLDMYARTLALYRESFGEAAPADIWSPADTRFGEDLAHRVVNTSRNWVIPKAPVRHAAGLAALFAAVAVFVPGCNGGLNPFALRGSEFLNFLIPALIGAVCMGRVLRSTRTGPEPTEAEASPELTWEEAAYLAGGPARLTTAAVARLVACRAAYVKGDRLVPGDHDVPGGGTAVERTVRSALPVTKSVEALAPVAKAVDAVFADGARKLEADGYLMSTSARAGAQFLAAAPLLIVLLGFALPRFVMGITNNKSVEYLVVTSIFGLFFGLVITLAGKLRVTRRGEHALARLKERHRPLQVAAGDGTGDVALAVALFGTAALIGSPIAHLGDWYPRQVSASASGGCGTAGCATGGCGGGAGGCGGGGGGCGGGGCGGCGGGD